MHTKGHFHNSLLDRHDVKGFKYWSDPGAFAEYKVKGDVGKFTGVWSTMIQAYVANKNLKLMLQPPVVRVLADI
jgi:amino acid permease